MRRTVGWTVASAADAWCASCAGSRDAVVDMYPPEDRRFVEHAVEPVHEGDELDTLTCEACGQPLARRHRATS